MEPGTTPLPSAVEPASQAKAPRRSAFRRPRGHPPEHGAGMLTRVLRTVRIDTIDNRSQVGVAMRRLREEMTADLGGEGEVTAAQRVLVEEAAKARIIAAAVGEWILRQESLVRPDGDLLPAVMQHSVLVANLARLLTALGLERRGKQAQQLRDYIEGQRNGAQPKC